MNSKTDVLLIDDDKTICSYVVTFLTRNSYRVTPAHSGMEGLSLAAANRPDLILLDLCLPDVDGCEVLRSLRLWNDNPVIILSSSKKERDKVQALDLGADDYVTKPFSPAELMARIRARLRRTNPHMPDNIYYAQGLKINFDTRAVSLDGADIHLTPLEYRLLSLLAEHSGHVMTYRYLLNTLWGPYIDDDNQILRVNMANIRRKIQKNPARPQYVFTETGIGYRIRKNEFSGQDSVLQKIPSA